MAYDMLIIAAYPDDAEVQMGGTIAKLTRAGRRILIVDLCDGEPADYAPQGARREQALRAANILGTDRVLPGPSGPLHHGCHPHPPGPRPLDPGTPPANGVWDNRGLHSPGSCRGRAARNRGSFLRSAQELESGPGGETLVDTEPWEIQRLFFPHCKMEPAWGDFAFAVDVSETYALKKKALAEYSSIFTVNTGDQLLELYEAEDAHMGRLFGVAYAEVFESHSPLLVTDPTVFLPGIHG